MVTFHSAECIHAMHDQPSPVNEIHEQLTGGHMKALEKRLLTRVACVQTQWGFVRRSALGAVRAMTVSPFTAALLSVLDVVVSFALGSC